MKTTSVIAAFSLSCLLPAQQNDEEVAVDSAEVAEMTSNEESELSNEEPEKSVEDTSEKEKEKNKPELAADRGSIFSRPDARVMTLAVPGVRGPILDRNGEPMAISKVSWYPALQFKQFTNGESKEEIIAWGRKRIEHANKIWGLKWNPKDEAIWEHYRFRRWMAMPYTFYVVTAAVKDQTEKDLMEGLILHPIYQRYYPHGKTAAHLIGYTGIKGKLEKGPINYGDPIFPYTHGKDGFEKLFDEQLSGRRGLKRLQYASDGTKFPEEVMQRPTVGGTVITTIDLKWQKRAEKVLEQKCKRGAIVVIDIQTGEVLVMASRPSFDLNLFVPRVLSKDYDKLRDDPDKPLFARAYKAAYPPASAFKPLVALAGLHKGVISRYETRDCPAFIEFNNHEFKDWSKKARGHLSVIPAIILSNNPFFYQIGAELKSSYFIDFARRFGYGKKTGLPLIGESPGNMPDDTWMLKHHKRRMHTGDHYNNAIGQGVLLSTPLQVAQGMAAIANGEYLPKLQLIRQVQDSKGKVIAANKPENKSPLRIDPMHIATVKEGMMKVVHGAGGTGRSARLSYATLCGKTGTGQWKPANEQFVAWFAGFFPLKEPKYAFAVLYEGDPKEKISGGRKAAPMVTAFFEPLEEEIKEALSPPARAVIVVEGAESDTNDSVVVVEDGDVPKAVIIDPETGEEVIPQAVVQPETNTQPEEEEIPKAVIAQPAPSEDEEESEEEEIPRAVPVEP